MRIHLCLAFIFVAVAQSHAASLPADAQKLLESFPEKKITLPLVLSRAIGASDSFKTVAARAASIPSSEYESKAPIDTVVLLGTSREVNRNQPISPFGATRTIQGGNSLGARSGFRTGTQLAVEVSDSYFDAVFSGFPGASSKFTNVKVEASQSLWRDFLGSGTRAGLLAGKSATEAAKLEWWDSVDQWVLDLVTIYYQAWGLQARVTAAERSLERRDRLKKIISVRAKRGTAETPDLLQVDGAMTAARSEVLDARQNLLVIWRNLIISLKMPEEWLKIDPADVPLALEKTIAPTLEACESSQVPATSPSVEMANLRRESAEGRADALVDRVRPDLSLKASVNSNAVAGYTSTVGFDSRFSDAIAGKNPAWTLGLQLQFPIGAYTERAAASRAVADRDQAIAAASMMKDQLKVDWLNHCGDLARWKKVLADQKSLLEKMQERVRLEETRYQQGRTSPTQVIQAGDDATSAELGLRNAEVQLHLAAWKVRRLQGEIRTEIRKLDTEKRLDQAGL
ncbi:MAG: TolC family protein [Bdellovibrionales bacterium]|nr:TolC family protein [Bdellovibrionales bacterium]